jgi:3-oxoacyl-[acyl-carrier protein] reductase
MMLNNCFRGQAVLVTGASTGIGAATARLIAENGGSVGIHYNRSEAAANALGSEIRASGSHAVVLQANLSERGEPERLVESFMKEFGSMRHLVNNAGALLRRATLAEITDDLLEKVMAVNLYSAVRTTRAAMPHLKATKGSVVNITSIAMRTGGGPGAGIYASAKGALNVFTVALAKELAPLGVRVNAVAPGVVDTPFHEKYSTLEQMARFAAATPLGRNGTPEDIASAICYLLSPAAKFITGETIDVNGGLFMHA